MKRYSLLSVLLFAFFLTAAPLIPSVVHAQDKTEQVDKKDKKKKKKKRGFFDWLFGRSSSSDDDSPKDKPAPDKRQRYNQMTEEELNYEFIDMAKKGNTDRMEQLLQIGANINARDMQGRTPLIEAARVGNYSIVLWLLQRGASVNVKDMYDGTALMYATREGNAKVVNLLVQSGARKNLDYR